MQRALVVVEQSERGRELIEIAGELAEGVNATLLLVLAIDESSYVEDIQRKIHSGIDVDSEKAAVAKAEESAAELGEEVLGDADLTYEAQGFMGSVPEDLLSLAEAEECDHVFVTGERRSPTGKAMFGDTAQRVLLNFDGPVTSLIV